MLNIFKKKNQDKKPRTNKDYTELGKQVEDMYQAINPDRTAVYRTAFFRGIFMGLGTVIGATVVITLLLWALSLFSELPLLGGFLESIQQTIEEQ